MLNHNRGTVLYLALIFCAFLNLLALAYTKCIPVEANSFLRSQRALNAHYACEAGVFDTMAWIRHELKHGREVSAGEIVVREGEHSGWFWRAEITPDPMSPPHGEASLRFFEILCRAWAPNVNVNTADPARIIRVSMGEETFARYTNYVDRMHTFYNVMSGGTFLEGHIHANSAIMMLISDDAYSNPAGPVYLGYMTSSTTANAPWNVDGVNYMELSQAPFDGEGTAIPERYEKLYLGGQAGLNVGVNRIELPDSSVGLENRAWGEDLTNPPTGRGLHVNAVGSMMQGGFFVVGDIESMTLEAIGQAASLITFTQLNSSGELDTTKIMEVYSGSATLDGHTVTSDSVGVSFPDSPFATFSNPSNGVFHATGSIKSLSGTNLGPRLISVDLASNQVIRITDSVTRADTNPGSRVTGPRDVLGLVAYRVVLGEEAPRSSSEPVYLYLSYLAGKEESFPGGGFQVEGWDDTSKPRGVFHLHGASGAGRSYPTGTGEGTVGFGYRHFFDEHLVENPPPHYPTTGKLPIRSWREEDGAL